MPLAPNSSLATTGDLAKRFGVDRDRIDYVIKTRGIEPATHAGHFRLFDAVASEAIGRELERIRLKREATQ